MIIPQELVPLKLFGLKALVRRLAESSEQFHFIKNELRIVQAGVNGERKLKRIFESYDFPFEHYILHDLHLSSTGKFQIDTLFLTRQGAVILEMKNIRGRIYFPSDRNQLVRTLDNGQTDAFECPSVQLERNCMLLGDWFKSRHMSVPISGVSVFAEVKQQFDNIRDNMDILFPMEVPGYLRNMQTGSEQLDSFTLKEIVSELTVANIEYNPFPLCTTYSIPAEDIRKGVICENCDSFGMIRTARNWVCTHCGNKDSNAHRQAIIDGFMLFGDSVTNRECRDFLGIEDAYTTKRLLNGMGLSAKGENKGRRYYVEHEKLRNILLDMNRSKVMKRR